MLHFLLASCFLDGFSEVFHGVQEIEEGVFDREDSGGTTDFSFKGIAADAATQFYTVELGMPLEGGGFFYFFFSWHEWRRSRGVC